jgi:hypothetical protein
MFVPFQSMPPESRLWIFQSDRKFSHDDKAIISESMELFTNGWAAHGQALKASYELRHDQFLLIAVDEGFNNASGCSIDASVHVIKAIEQKTGIALLGREQVAFLRGTEVFLLPVKSLKELYQDGAWNAASLMFNNVLTTKGQLENEWVVPAGNTWLKRYVPSKTLAN